MTMPTVTEMSRHFTASAVVFDMPRRLVLLVHHLGTGMWQFPGGHVDPDETGDQTAVREVMEETGVSARLCTTTRLAVPGGRWQPEPLMVVEFPAPAKPGRGEPAHHHLDMLYVATADSAAPVRAQEDEVAGVRWVDLDGLDRPDIRPDVPAVSPLAWAFAAGQLSDARL